MATLNTQGSSLYYEVPGNPASPSVLMVSGLGGVGKSWGPQIARFAESYYVNARSLTDQAILQPMPNTSRDFNLADHRKLE